MYNIHKIKKRNERIYIYIFHIFLFFISYFYFFFLNIEIKSFYMLEYVAMQFKQNKLIKNEIIN